MRAPLAAPAGVHPAFRRFLFRALPALGLLLAGCGDLFVAPAPPAPASVAVSFSLGSASGAASAADPTAAYEQANQVRIRLAREGVPELITTLAFEPAGAETRLRVPVELSDAREEAQLSLELLRDGAALFRASAPVVLRSGAATEVAPALQPVPSRVQVQPVPVMEQLGQTVQLSGAVLFATGHVIPGLALTWQSLNTGVVEVSPSGVLVSRASGEARVVGRYATLADTVRVQVRLPVPAAPTNLAATAASATQINLAWADNSTNETEFRIERCQGAGCTNFTQVATVPANVTTFTSQALAANTTYRYRVRACGLSGCSGYSNEIAVTTQAPPVGGFEARAISVGASHTCALTPTGQAYCWGLNTSGQLGNGTIGTGTRMVPTAVAGGLTFASISAGRAHTCALTPTGQAYCWGSNISGQLGDGTTTNQFVPTAVAGGLTFASIGAGATDETCALTPTGQAYCWGSNTFGQLGDGTTTRRLMPTAVAGGLTFASISAGGNRVCALTPRGQAYCWGNNGSGQLGDGTTSSSQMVPTAVAGGLTFASISAGFSHTCALTPTGQAYCWGINGSGRLGDGTTTNRLVPTAVAGGLTFASISAGFSHTCGIAMTGQAYCWGLNQSGQLGDGTTTTRLVPTAVIGELTFASISAGFSHTCGIAMTGQAYCWGLNQSGQLGDGTTMTRLVPTAVIGGTTSSASLSASGQRNVSGSTRLQIHPAVGAR